MAENAATRNIPSHVSLPAHVDSWYEARAKQERRRKTEVMRLALVDLYEAAHPSKPNGAHPKQDNKAARA
jgi:hypothetical protein